MVTSDPSDDEDAQLVQVRPPTFSLPSIFLISSGHCTHFLNAPSNERFQLSSLIRLGKETFHARGERFYPPDTQTILTFG